MVLLAGKCSLSSDDTPFVWLRSNENGLPCFRSVFGRCPETPFSFLQDIMEIAEHCIKLHFFFLLNFRAREKNREGIKRGGGNT